MPHSKKTVSQSKSSKCCIFGSEDRDELIPSAFLQLAERKEYGLKGLDELFSTSCCDEKVDVCFIKNKVVDDVAYEEVVTPRVENCLILIIF